MSNPLTPKTACRRCGAAGDASDNYCRQCGAAMAATPQPDEDNAAAARADSPVAAAHSAVAFAEQPRWTESPWVILPLLFLLLGPLAFGMLWRSRRFSRPWKIILTIVVTGITLLVCWKLWLLFQQVWAWVEEIKKAQLQDHF
jgi:hypothetical protein